MYYAKYSDIIMKSCQKKYKDNFVQLLTSLTIL